MKITDRLLSVLGVDRERRTPPPRYRAIADGLLVTSTRTETVLEIDTETTDLLSPEDVLDHIESVARTAGAALQGAQCQLRVLWGRITGDSYAEEMLDAGPYTTGDWQRWVTDRAESIDALAMPSRYVLLHITQSGDRDEATQAVTDAATDAFGLTTYGLSERELAYRLGEAQRMARRLSTDRFSARLAPAELIAWEVGRESKREVPGTPDRSGVIAGAPLAALTAGRVVPMSDHLRFYAADGTVAAYSAVLPILEFPEELPLPGAEWLRALSSVKVLEEVDEDANGEPIFDEVDAGVEASVRFTIMPTREARHEVSEARKSAKEQRLSAAKSVAAEPAEDILDAEATMSGIESELKRSQGVRLVTMHPRFIVSGASRDELNAKLDSLRTFYDEMGITVGDGADDQKDLWLETLPGDHVRVNDLRHVTDAELLFGSLFWGGSAVGPDEGPVQHWLTGSTPGFTRFDVTRSSRERDATTVALFGLSGRGKSLAGLLMMLEQAFMGGWGLVLDFKGDMTGVVNVAAEYGLPHSRTVIDEAASGALDLFGALADRDSAKEAVARLLQLLAPPNYADIAEDATLAATTAVAEALDEPSTWAAIQWLLNQDNHNDERWARLGKSLTNLANTTLGRPVAGPRESSLGLPTDPGLWLVQMPGLTLPGMEKSQRDWDQTERLSMALMRSVITTAVAITGAQSMRSMPKTIMIPEVHNLLKITDGASFLDTTARIGSANRTHLILDSQDVVGVASHEGLVEQLNTVYCFHLQSKTQQHAAAEVLNLPETPATYSAIGGLARSSKKGVIRKGHCIMRDSNHDAAQVQWQVPTPRVLELLDTTAPENRTGVTTPDTDAPTADTPESDEEEAA